MVHLASAIKLLHFFCTLGLPTVLHVLPHHIHFTEEEVGVQRD